MLASGELLGCPVIAHPLFSFEKQVHRHQQRSRERNKAEKSEKDDDGVEVHAGKEGWGEGGRGEGGKRNLRGRAIFSPLPPSQTNGTPGRVGGFSQGRFAPLRWHNYTKKQNLHVSRDQAYFLLPGVRFVWSFR